MSKRDYYDVLGVGRDADSDAIKKAYRRLAMKYHPDRNSGDTKAEEKFKEVQEAYSFLSDAEKRSAYDRFGHDAFNAGGGPEPDFSSFFGSVFQDFFGGSGSGDSGGRQRQRRRRRVLDIELTFQEMAEGCHKDIRLSLPTHCDDCSGSGAAAGSGAKTCDTCGGEGRVRMQRSAFILQQTCPRCHGEGRVIDKPCRKCNGVGAVKKSRRLAVNIPAGIEDSAMVRVNVDGVNEEEIFLRPHILPHPIFTRDGENLHVEIPVSITTAALGNEMEVPSVRGGKLRVKIPPGIQSGQVLRVSEAGLPSMRSHRRGHLMCHLIVETPVNLNSEQKKLLQAFDDSLKNKHTPHGNSWLEKAKSLFTDS